MVILSSIFLLISQEQSRRCLHCRGGPEGVPRGSQGGPKGVPRGPLGEVRVDPPVVVLPLDVLPLDEALDPLLDDGGRRLEPGREGGG